MQSTFKTRLTYGRLHKAADAAANAGGTAASYSDPAVVLIVNKIESLVHSNERFSEAYAQCKAYAQAD